MTDYYFKKGKRYVKCGIGLRDYPDLPMGVYYVRDNGSQGTSVAWHKINEGEILDVLKAVDSIELTERLTKIISELDRNGKSVYDCAKEISKQLLNSIK